MPSVIQNQGGVRGWIQGVRVGAARQESMIWFAAKDPNIQNCSMHTHTLHVRTHTHTNTHKLRKRRCSARKEYL